MAQADWDFSGATWTGGLDGQERLHSALADPLTGWGDYCREYVNGNTANSTAFIKSTVEGGTYYQVPSTKAVSLRAWVRRGTQQSPGWTTVALAAKAASGSSWNGYYLAYGNDTLNNTGLYLRGATTGWDQTILSSGLALNIWHRLRMDIVPVGSQDDVSIYTATTASPDTWIERLSFSINSSQAGYRAWGSASYPRFGYGIRLTNSFTPITYVDGFEMLVKDV